MDSGYVGPVTCFPCSNGGRVWDATAHCNAAITQLLQCLQCCQLQCLLGSRLACHNTLNYQSLRQNYVPHSVAVSVCSCYSLQPHINFFSTFDRATTFKTLVSHQQWALDRLYCYTICSVAQMCNFCKKRSCSHGIARGLVEFAVELHRIVQHRGALAWQDVWNCDPMGVCRCAVRSIAESLQNPTVVVNPLVTKSSLSTGKHNFLLEFFATTVSDICDSLRQDESICVDLESDFMWDKKRVINSILTF